MIYYIDGLIFNQTNANGVNITGSEGVTPVPSNITEDTLIEVTIADDPNPIFNFRGEEIEYLIKSEDDGYLLRSEEGEFYAPFIDMTWTDTFGETFIYPILINL
jgi:hypothetical protein